MPPRDESDEKYLLDLVAQILAEPDYRWQHRFPTLLGDPGKDGKRRSLPVDGYFPRHRLIVEYWETQHSAPVPIMDQGSTISGVSRGHQRRLYDRRRQAWADANGLKLVILDYRGFETDEQGRLRRRVSRDRAIVAGALRTAGVITEPGRVELEMDSYLKEATGECYICRLAKGEPSLAPLNVIWRSEDVIVFLNRYPTVYGSMLVAPMDHREQVTGDFTLHEYLALQRVIYAIAQAVRENLRPERVYILSLGSQEAVAHVHWHIVPCPPGVPLDRQQLSMLDAQKRGVLQLSHEEGEDLARLIRSYLPGWMKTGPHGAGVKI